MTVYRIEVPGGYGLARREVGVGPNAAILTLIGTAVLASFCGYDTSLAVRREGKAGADVLFGQLRIVSEDFLMRHARGEPAWALGLAQAL
jgi:hypothetical protein